MRSISGAWSGRAASTALGRTKTAINAVRRRTRPAEAELAKPARRTRVADPKTAYDTDGADASRTELAAIAASIPTGPPDLVARWWAGLTPAEQEKPKLAAPATIGTLAGIPDAVKGELRGDDGLDRVKLIQYALDNWNKKNEGIHHAGDIMSDAMTRRAGAPRSRAARRLTSAWAFVVVDVACVAAARGLSAAYDDHRWRFSSDCGHLVTMPTGVTAGLWITAVIAALSVACGIGVLALRVARRGMTVPAAVLAGIWPTILGFAAVGLAALTLRDGTPYHVVCGG